MDIVKQLDIYAKEDDPEKRKEHFDKFMRMLMVKIVETAVNKEDPELVFKNIRTAIEEYKVDRYNRLTKAFSEIYEILFK